MDDYTNTVVREGLLASVKRLQILIDQWDPSSVEVATTVVQAIHDIDKTIEADLEA